jgi:hypothetical protein
MSTKSEVKLPTQVLFKPTEFEASVYKAGLNSAKPPFTFHCGDWERHALPVLSESTRGYVYGNAGAGETYAKKPRVFQKIQHHAASFAALEKQTRMVNRSSAMHLPLSLARNWTFR